jgi:two-component system, chemotaxis family, chemotaxis protein CheY
MIAVGKILIVDDSAMMRMVLRKSLTMARVQAQEIIEASNGVEALKLLEEQRFDIMFCDLNMPGMNGDDLLSKASQTASMEVPPVVIVSAEATPERIERLQCERLIGVLRKPFLPEMIAKLVGESRLFNDKELAK